MTEDKNKQAEAQDLDAKTNEASEAKVPQDSQPGTEAPIGDEGDRQKQTSQTGTETTPETEKIPEDKAPEKPHKTQSGPSAVEAADDVAMPAATAEEETTTKDAGKEAQAPVDKIKKQENQSPDRDNFDWERFEVGRDDYSDEERDSLEQLYSETLNDDVEEHQILEGRVVAVTDKDVVLNIGYKSDGLVPLSEFKYRKSLDVGDEVTVMIETKEDKNGQIVLSHRKAMAEKAWDTIVDAYENDKILGGYIKDRTKGGMITEVLGLDAFMPGSQIDIRPIKDYDSYVGQHMDIKVVKLNPAFRNIVVSHKAIIESDLEEQKAEILSKLEKGQVLEGIVKNLTSFGVFVDLGGVDGLVHITDVSWGRISHPEEVLELGEKINVVVLDYDEEKKRISLGLKQLTPHPWETLDEELKDGSRVKGKVVNIEDYGAFVEIKPGVEGLVHVSEMSWSNHLKSPQEYVQLGEEVECVVLNIDREERKLSLGMKQLSEDPWEHIQDRYPVGSRHMVKVKGIMNFGLFVELEEGIDGLVHISDLSWTKKYNHPKEFTKEGETLEVAVLDIDKENRRLSLGIKQLEEDPWDTFASIFLEGTVHEGTIVRIDDKGAIVQLPYSVEGFAPNKHLMKEDKGKVKTDETLEFRVREFDRESRKIILSHTDIWKEAERQQRRSQQAEKRKEDTETRETLKKVKKSVNRSQLAEEVDVLAQLKQRMESEEREKQQKAMEEMDKRMQSDEEAPTEGSAEGSEASDEAEAPEAPTKNTAPNQEPGQDTPGEDAEGSDVTEEGGDDDEKK